MGRRRQKQAGLAALIAALVAIAAQFIPAGETSPTPRDQVSLPSQGEAEATLIRASDGDTLKVMIADLKESVRLIGIDAPESHPNERALRLSKKTGEPVKQIVIKGKRSAQFVASLLSEGDKLRLVYDRQKRDRFGRLLAYVYLPDGRMLQEVIIQEGYATPLTIAPNNRFRHTFEAEYVAAQRHKKGLWR